MNANPIELALFLAGVLFFAVYALLRVRDARLAARIRHEAEEAAAEERKRSAGVTPIASAREELRRRAHVRSRDGNEAA